MDICNGMKLELNEHTKTQAKTIISTTELSNYLNATAIGLQFGNKNFKFNPHPRRGIETTIN